MRNMTSGNGIAAAAPSTSHGMHREEGVAELHDDRRE